METRGEGAGTETQQTRAELGSSAPCLPSFVREATKSHKSWPDNNFTAKRSIKHSNEASSKLVSTTPTDQGHSDFHVEDNNRGIAAGDVVLRLLLLITIVGSVLRLLLLLLLCNYALPIRMAQGNAG